VGARLPFARKYCGRRTVIVGIDLLSELDRITFQLGLRDNLSFEQSKQTAEKASFTKGIMF